MVFLHNSTIPDGQRHQSITYIVGTAFLLITEKFTKNEFLSHTKSLDHKYFVNDTEGSKAIQFDCFDEFLIAQSLSRKIIENEISICTFYIDFSMSDQKLNFPR